MSKKLLLSANDQALKRKSNMPKLSELEGQWFIHQSNFPMWLKGDKKFPTFNYTVTVRNEQNGLADAVRYTQSGKEKEILGFDTPLNAAHTVFEWRGDGFLSLLKSRWQILHWEAAEAWSLIYFDKTLFTPAGYDVISRHRTLSSQAQTQISAVLHTHGIEALLSPIPQV